MRDDKPSFMTGSQRTEIRSLFAALAVSDARGQFDLVNELIGVRLVSVGDLTALDAQRLIPILRGRVATRSRASTGSSWSDRDEDTWIDKL